MPRKAATRRSSASIRADFPGKPSGEVFRVERWDADARIGRDGDACCMVTTVTTNRSFSRFGPDETASVGNRPTRTRHGLVSRRQADWLGPRQAAEQQAAEDEKADGQHACSFLRRRQAGCLCRRRQAGYFRGRRRAGCFHGRWQVGCFRRRRQIGCFRDWRQAGYFRGRWQVGRFLG